MKKNILTIILLYFVSLSAFAQLDSNTKAKLYFTEAEKLYNQGDFNNSQKYLVKADEALGGKKVARTMGLMIKILYAKGEFIAAKSFIDGYTSQFMDSASKELNDEILALYINIEEGAEKQKQNVKNENARIDRINNMNKEEILRFINDNFPNGSKVEESYFKTSNFVNSYISGSTINATYKPRYNPLLNAYNSENYLHDRLYSMDLNFLEEITVKSNNKIQLVFEKDKNAVVHSYEHVKVINGKTRRERKKSYHFYFCQITIENKSKLENLHLGFTRLIELNSK